jgi:hypothetical protein
VGSYLFCDERKPEIQNVTLRFGVERGNDLNPFLRFPDQFNLPLSTRYESNARAEKANKFTQQPRGVPHESNRPQNQQPS